MPKKGRKKAERFRREYHREQMRASRVFAFNDNRTTSNVSQISNDEETIAREDTLQNRHSPVNRNILSSTTTHLEQFHRQQQWSPSTVILPNQNDDALLSSTSPNQLQSHTEQQYTCSAATVTYPDNENRHSPVSRNILSSTTTHQEQFHRQQQWSPSTVILPNQNDDALLSSTSPNQLQSHTEQQYTCSAATVTYPDNEGIQPYHPARLAGLFRTSFTEITDEVIEVAINMMRSFSNEETTPYICYYTPVQLEYYCSETPQYQELHVQKLPTDKSSVNIHHLPGHWVTSYYNHTSGHIHVFDSLMCNSHLQDVSKQLMIMYEQNKVNNIIYERVTQQSIEPICGLMAIAFAYTCLNAKNPAHVHYDITKVRSHFQQCILDGHLSEFPSKNLHLPITQEQSPFHRTTPLEMYFNDQFRKNLEKQAKSNIHTVQDKKQRHAIWKANNRVEKKQRQTQKEIDSQKKLDKERMAAIRAQRKQNQTPEEINKEKKLLKEKKATRREQKKQSQTPEEINKERKLHREKMAASRSQKKQNQTPAETYKERKLHREKKAASRSQKKQNQTPEEINKEKKLLKEKNATRREQKKQSQTPGEINKERKLLREKMAASRSQKKQNQTPAEMIKETKLHREKMAASRSQKKQNQSPEEIDKEKKLDKKRMAAIRAQRKQNQTPEEINKEKKLLKEKKATRREQKKQNQTPEEINKEKKLLKEKKATRREQKKQNQTPEEINKEKKLLKEKKATRREQKKQNQTPEEINKEKKLLKEKKATRREQKKQNQTPEEINKEKKLLKEKKATRREQKKQNQTPEEINKEKKLLREKNATRREQKKQNQTQAAMNKERKLHREKMAASRSQKKQNQTPAEIYKERKLHREKKASCRAEKRQNQTTENNEFAKLKDRHRKMIERYPLDILVSIQQFQRKIKSYANYICTCCHRLLYKRSVTKVTARSLPNLLKEMKNKCFQNIKSVDNFEWICNTCKSYLARNKLPPQADANDLSAPEVPFQLKQLTSLEVRLLCQRYPFMKLLALPKGKQSGLKGTVVNVPIDHETVCKSLPLTPREASLIPLKLKRRIRYKGYEKFQYISPDKVLQGLTWLKKNNHLYQTENIKENKQWQQSCSEEDSEMWKDLTENQEDKTPSRQPSCSNQNTLPQETTTHQQINHVTKHLTTESDCVDNVQTFPDHEHISNCVSVYQSTLDNSDETENHINSPKTEILDKQTIAHNESSFQPDVTNTESEKGNTELHTISQLNSHQDCNNQTNFTCDNTHLSEEDVYEDDPVSRLRGVRYDTCVQSVNPVLDVDKVVNIAPGENKQPISILMDDKFEEMAFPHLLPYGKFGWKHKRETPISAKKYFQKRILDANAQFARDVEYLFVAQTITETKQIMDSMTVALRKCHRGSDTHPLVTAGFLRDSSAIQQIIFKDQAYRFMQPVRGTPPYWQKVQYKLLAAIKQLGIFTWFFTLSAADLKWHDTIQEIRSQVGQPLSDDEVDALTWEQKCEILRSNPVTAARHFQYRLDLFLKHVILGKAQPIGPVLHYFYRIEFQQRGSPHAHGVVWIKGAPDPEKDSPQTISAFVDKYIDCELPAEDRNPELYSLVSQLQKHAHTASCTKREKTCRFNFPRPISSETVVTTTGNSDITPELLEKNKDSAKETLSVVKTFLQETSEVEEMSYEQVLKSCNIQQQTYQNALKISSDNSTVYLKRSPSAININNYNKWMMLGWQANMDIQFVSNPYACIEYIIKYITKEERDMGTLLQAVEKETKDAGIREQMKKCGQTFLNARSVSAQEAAYRLLGLPLYKSNFDSVWIPSGLPEERVRLLKSLNSLDNLEDDDENVFVAGLLEKYAARPNRLENWFLALFASWYQPDYKDNQANDFHPDVLEKATSAHDVNPSHNVTDAPSSIKIELSTTTINMRKRKKQAVIRYHKFSEYRQPDSFYHSQLLLFVPWRNEKVDLLRGYDTYVDSFTDCEDTITANRSYILKHEQLIDEAMENSEQQSTNAWDVIAAETQHEQYDCDEEGTQEDPDHAILLPGDNLRHGQETLHLPQPGVSLPMAIESQPLLLPFDDYSKHMQTLNKEQYEVLQIILNWCVSYRQTKQQQNPLHLFISGGAGTGKSHLIKAIYQTIQLILRTEGEQPDLPKVLLLAPTGTAAFNIEGITIHSAFLLKIRSSKKKKKQNTTYQPLSDEKKNSLRTKLSALCFIIIDEISMVGSDLILRVHHRLNELFGGQKIFGGISIITFGDMYQIRPVGQRFIFLPPTDRYAALAPSLWNNFKFMELNMIMRQREDKEFAEMLNRIRTASHTEEDLKLLRRCTYEDESTIPADTLHVFPTNAEVDEFNDKMLEELPGPLVTLTAIDKKPAALKNYCLSDNPTYTGGLPTTIKLKKGAQIMLIRNIDVSDGLANGSTGKVIDFKYSEHGTVLAVFVKFDNKRVGRNARLQSPFDLSGFGPDVVPITPVEVQFSPNDNNLTVTRKQFPLKLCWASTFHKVQGATVNRIAISFEKGLRAGQAYVALSRSKTLDGIYVKIFSEKQIKADDDVVLEMKRLAAEQTITKPFDIFESHSVSLATLNARSARLHFNDIKNHPLLRQTDILCITETNITQKEAHLYQIPDTHMICLGHSSESNCHGLAFYVKAAILAEKQTSFHYPFLELLCVTTHSARFLRKICLVYRSPSTQIGTFIEKLTEYIADQNPDIILGDMNIDIRSTSYKKLINALPSYLQLVDKPTHISGSTLDLAFQRSGCTGVKVNVFPTYFSDHSIVHLVKKVP